MVDKHKAAYKSSSRGGKALTAMKMVQDWRAQDPPGRFLALNEDSRQYYDVGKGLSEAGCT